MLLLIPLPVVEAIRRLPLLLAGFGRRGAFPLTGFCIPAESCHGIVVGALLAGGTNTRVRRRPEGAELFTPFAIVSSRLPL